MFYAICSRAKEKRDIRRKFYAICPGVKRKRDMRRKI